MNTYELLIKRVFQLLAYNKSKNVYSILIISNQIVNAEAREEVINNRQANFTECNDGLENPTCGQMLINEETIPFSRVRIVMSKRKSNYCCNYRSDCSDKGESFNQTLHKFHLGNKSRA